LPKTKNFRVKKNDHPESKKASELFASGSRGGLFSENREKVHIRVWGDTRLVEGSGKNTNGDRIPGTQSYKRSLLGKSERISP